jgi:hypothetical protein
MRLRNAVASVLVALPVLLVPDARAADCGCPETGPYQRPATEEISVGTSPSGKFSAAARNGSAEVTRANGALVHSEPYHTDSAWGFSPDDDRFVLFYSDNGTVNVRLVNLAAAGGPRLVRFVSVRTATASVSFSPNGHYLLIAYRPDSRVPTTNLELYDARTGELVASPAFTPLPPPADDAGAAGWGFSPDDHAFAYAFADAQRGASLQVLDLSARTGGYSIQLPGNAIWRFSPCGDAIGILGEFENIRALAVRVGDGVEIGEFDIVGAGSVSFRATATEHQVVVAGVPHRLGANTAGEACATTAVLDRVSLSPGSVVGGGDVTGTITFRTLPAGDVDVVLSSDDPGVAAVPATVTTRARTKPFTITTRAVTMETPVTITATAGGVTRTAQLLVTGETPDPRPAAVTFYPSTVQGGETATATVALDRVAPFGAMPVLTGSGAASGVAAFVRIQGGQDRATVALPTTAVATPAAAGLTAAWRGLSATGTLPVVPAANAANAMNPDAACLQNPLGGTDDISSSAIAIGFPVTFAGKTYDQLWVNENGNVTFGGDYRFFTPLLANTGRPTLAPFFAGVDTTFLPGSISWGRTTVGGRAAFCANWNGVGYFQTGTDKRNRFQVVLIDRSDRAPGDFDFQFNYDAIRWDSANRIGTLEALNGFGVVPPRVGYFDGAATTDELPGSGALRTLLDWSPTALTRRSRDSAIPGRYVFEVRNGTPPAAGAIAGRVLDPGGAGVAGAQVQVCDQDGACTTTSSAAGGGYQATGLAGGEYTVTAFPPASSVLAAASLGPLALADGAALGGRDVRLLAPVVPPAGTSVSPMRGTAQSVPIVYWGEPVRVVTHGCAGASGTYSVTVGTAVIASGGLVESPAGTYTGKVPPLAPRTGVAHVALALDCPASAGESVGFDVYIDPSGTFRALAGTPVANATVTLYRADSPTATFAPVEGGSAIMSPLNRRNPDTTGSDGRFGWDVIAGYYKVRAQAVGCVAPDDPSRLYVETGVLTIPPPVTDLDLRLACPQEPRPDEDPMGELPITDPGPEPSRATLALSVGGPAVFGPLRPGRDSVSSATTSVHVTATTSAALTVSDAGGVAPGRLVGAAGAIPAPVMASAGGPFATVGAAPAALRSWSAPADEAVGLVFQQRIAARDRLTAGSYAKALTLTLAATTP